MSYIVDPFCLISNIFDTDCHYQQLNWLWFITSWHLPTKSTYKNTSLDLQTAMLIYDKPKPLYYCVYTGGGVRFLRKFKLSFHYINWQKSPIIIIIALHIVTLLCKLQSIISAVFNLKTFTNSVHLSIQVPYPLCC